MDKQNFDFSKEVELCKAIEEFYNEQMRLIARKQELEDEIRKCDENIRYMTESLKNMLVNRSNIQKAEEAIQ